MIFKCNRIKSDVFYVSIKVAVIISSHVRMLPQGVLAADAQRHGRKEDRGGLPGFQLELDQQAAGQKELGPADIQPPAHRHGGYAGFTSRRHVFFFPSSELFSNHVIFRALRQRNAGALRRAAELLCTNQRPQEMHPFPSRPV